MDLSLFASDNTAPELTPSRSFNDSLTASRGSLSLWELQHKVGEVLGKSFPRELWVHGELAEGRANPNNGHFYGELVEKDADGRTVAKARVNCWRSTFLTLRAYFRKLTGKEFEAGIKVLVCVRVSFNEQYGYSLNIQDVDPNYTIGDAELRRRQTLEKLKEDGLLDANRQLPLPLLTQRIAIISSASAAGYGDFSNHLAHNPQGFGFVTKLFPALMQGEKAPESIIEALDLIASEADKWDAVVIIRGGGAVTDLSDFDSYPLAVAIAQFPLPVITGIGHDRDTTVADCVAHTSLKTPTAVAGFLIDRLQGQADRLEALRKAIASSAHSTLSEARLRLSDAQGSLLATAHARLNISNDSLNDLQRRLLASAQIRLNISNDLLNDLQRRLTASAQIRLSISKDTLAEMRQRLAMATKEQLFANRQALAFASQRFAQTTQGRIASYISRLDAVARQAQASLRLRVEAESHKLELLASRIHSLDPVNIMQRGYSITLVDGKAIRSTECLKEGQRIETILEKGRITSSITSWKK